MMKTIAGLFPSVDDAHAAANDLMANGFSSDEINIVASKGESVSKESGDTSRSEEMGKGAATGALTGGAIGGVAGLVAAAVGLTIPGIGPVLAAGPIIAALTGAGVGAAAGGIIGALTKMGIPEEEAHYYAEGVRRGGTLVSAQADNDRMASKAAEIMDAHNAMDIEGLAEDWRSQGWRGFAEESETTIPVTEEHLKVGKRKVSRGGVRVYSHVEETPVEEDISLREEHADIERRPVDRPVSASDEAFKEKSVEIKETAEEPVLEKSARVVEEVTVGKEAREREEKIRDTVRRTDVEVERSGAHHAGPSRYTGPERRRASSSMAYTGPERRQQPWPGGAPM